MGFGHKIFSDPSGESVDQNKYKGMIRSLLYLTTSCLDTMFSTCLCDRFQANPKMSHLLVVKQICRYHKGTKSLEIWYPTNESFMLQAYLDSKYGGLQLDRKSTSGGCQFMSGRSVSWSSKKQNYIALSRAEVEYITTTSCISQILWIKFHLLNCGFRFQQIPIYYNS